MYIYIFGALGYFSQLAREIIYGKRRAITYWEITTDLETLPENSTSFCLNNLRLIIQPVVLLWSIFPWLQVFPNRDLLLGFHQLIAVVNQFSFVFNTE
jgi:SRSO17 transposase